MCQISNSSFFFDGEKIKQIDWGVTEVKCWSVIIQSVCQSIGAYNVSVAWMTKLLVSLSCWVGHWQNEAAVTYSIIWSVSWSVHCAVGLLINMFSWSQSNQAIYETNWLYPTLYVLILPSMRAYRSLPHLPHLIVPYLTWSFIYLTSPNLSFTIPRLIFTLPHLIIYCASLGIYLAFKWCLPCLTWCLPVPPRSALSSTSMRWSDHLPSSAARRRCAASALMSSGRRPLSVNSALASCPTATTSSASSASASGARRSTLKTRLSGRSRPQVSITC